MTDRRANDRLRQARTRRESPSGSGRRLSRRELADLVNAELAERGLRHGVVDDKYVGKLERGEHRWPQRAYREAFRAVLGACTDAELGFYVMRRESPDPPLPQSVTPTFVPLVSVPMTLGRRRSRRLYPNPMFAGRSPRVMTDDQQPWVTPDEIADCMKELGDELAAYRNAARLTQHELARRLLCSRSSVANIEIGRNTAPQDFWLAADRVLAADGLLVKGAGRVTELKRAYVLQVADERRRAAATACAHRSDCPCSVVVARWTGRETRALREALRMGFPDFARVVNISPGSVVRLERSPQTSPRLPVQAALDRVLLRAAPDVRARFHQLRELDDSDGPRRTSENR